mmetsp:Transcript_67479/g.106825  ORF Transcript_67479/g.106825 Transcript_67479/m.106825 type:complete len:164 (-) Transcript_67479:39-530(-)
MRLAVNVFSLLPWWIVGVSLALLVSVSHAVEEESLGENLQEIPLSSGVRHSPAAHSRQLANLLLHTPSLQKNQRFSRQQVLKIAGASSLLVGVAQPVRAIYDRLVEISQPNADQVKVKKAWEELFIDVAEYLEDPNPPADKLFAKQKTMADLKKYDESGHLLT